jgi:hypothetical protein
MAPNLIRVGDLDINQDMSFQRRTWRVQRIGWVVLAVIITGAACGLFGNGPLSRSLADAPSLPFQIEYERLSRYHSPQTLRLHLKDGAAVREPFTVWLSDDYAARVSISSISPEPGEVHRSGGGFLYRFRMDPSPSGQIILRLEADAVGPLTGFIGLDPTHTVSISQWIYP